MRKITSKSARGDELFIRDKFSSNNRWGIPTIKCCDTSNYPVKLMSFSSVKRNDTKNFDKAVHFFKDDYRMESVYNKPYDKMEVLAQYRCLITPDYSIYTDLPLAIQIYNVFKSRWCGAFWQDYGKDVIPSVSWGDASSFDFCFEGIEENSAVFVSTIGVRKKETDFLQGYNVMLDKIKPNTIFCLGHPFDAMDGNVIFIDYKDTFAGGT
ncbi:MAG: DUF4417 domain-containing protein [Anaerovoracaceae bacterium]